MEKCLSIWSPAFCAYFVSAIWKPFVLLTCQTARCWRISSVSRLSLTTRKNTVLRSALLLLLSMSSGCCALRCCVAWTDDRSVSFPPASGSPPLPRFETTVSVYFTGSLNESTTLGTHLKYSVVTVDDDFLCRRWCSNQWITWHRDCESHRGLEAAVVHRLCTSCCRPTVLGGFYVHLDAVVRVKSDLFSPFICRLDLRWRKFSRIAWWR